MLHGDINDKSLFQIYFSQFSFSNLVKKTNDITENENTIW